MQATLRDAVDFGSDVCKDSNLSHVRFCLFHEVESNDPLVVVFQDSAAFRDFVVYNYTMMGEYALDKEGVQGIDEGWEWMRALFRDSNPMVFAIGISEERLHLILNTCKLTSLQLSAANWKVGNLPFIQRLFIWGNKTPRS